MEVIKVNENENQKKGIVISRKTIVIIAVLFLLLLAGGVAVGLNLANKKEGSGETQGGSVETVAQTDSSKPDIELDENAGAYTGELPKDKSNDSAVGIKIPGYPSITIAKDTQDVKMALLNPEGNPCYFKFVIALKENDETLFESKYVKPGDCIYDVHLAKPLAAGEHPAVIKISTISLDSGTPLNGANVETVLIAK